MTRSKDAIISTDDTAEIERARLLFRRKMSARAYIRMAVDEKANRDHPGFGCASYLSIRSVHGTKFAWDQATANAAHASHDPESCDREPSDTVTGIGPGSILQYGRPHDFETVGSDIGNMTVLVLALSVEDGGVRAAQVCPVYGNPFSNTDRAKPGEVDIEIPPGDGERRGTPAIAYPRDIRHCLVDRASFAFGAERSLRISDEDLSAVIAMRNWIVADDQAFKSGDHPYGSLRIRIEGVRSARVQIAPKTSYALSRWRGSADAYVTCAIRERLAIDLKGPSVTTPEGRFEGDEARALLRDLNDLMDARKPEKGRRPTSH